MSAPAGWRAVGRVVALYRHPVKSMAAQALDRAELDRYGLAGDRRFALRRCDDATGFPWLTAGRLPALVRYRVSCADGALTRAALRIHPPEGAPLLPDDVAAHFADAFGVRVELMHLQQGVYDWSGLSVISRQTLDALGALVGRTLDVRRFRPNVVVDVDGSPGGATAGAYPEDAWVGRTLALGDPGTGARAAVTDPDERCSMIGLDPDTGAADPGILKAVVGRRANLAGVYAVPTRPGPLAVGDVVYLDEPHPA